MTNQPSLSVLLVDDQKFVGMAVGRLLSGQRDVTLHCCYTGADAIAQANQLAPSVILQDLVMPDIDGLTLVGLFRANPATASTPIIVLSGNDDASAKGRALAAGANDYLVKLPDQATLVACIRGQCSGNAPAAPIDTPIDAALDRGVIASLREAGPGASQLVTALIDQFIQEATSLVERIAAAVASGDTRALKVSAHSLRGASMTMGARQLSVLGGQAEDYADGKPGAGLDPRFTATLNEEFGRVRAACLQEQQSLRECSPSQS